MRKYQARRVPLQLFSALQAAPVKRRGSDAILAASRFATGGPPAVSPPPPPCCFLSTLSPPSVVAPDVDKANKMNWPMMQRGPRDVHLYNFEEEKIPYTRSWEWMKDLIKHRTQKDDNGIVRDTRDVFLLLEHSPVYTLGKASTVDNIKFPMGSQCQFEVHRVERGGEVTFHGPGQITGYPMIDLNFYKRDLHWYLRRLEEVIILVLKEYGLKGFSDPEYTGVWLEGKKVAAIGINVSRWITIHGFALNVTTDLNYFQHIVPCGIADKPVGSLQEFVPGIEMAKVRLQLISAFEDVFNARCILEQKCRKGHHPFLVKD